MRCWENDEFRSASTSQVICIAENRQEFEPSIRILISSICEQCPGLPIYLFAPNSTSEFKQWIAKRNNVTLSSSTPGGEWNKYDIKPQALMSVLNSGYESVIWLDSDTVITRDLIKYLGPLSSDVLVVTEEALGSFHEDPEGLRTKGWGLEVGRVIPFALNTAVLRVTHEHMNILVTWDAMLKSDTYKDAQASDWSKRPVHCLGDQEVLNALLCSRQFQGVKIKILKRGRDIIQYFGSSGYTVKERLLNVVSGIPPIIHSQWHRPWLRKKAADEKLKSSDAFMSLYYKLSPYVFFSQRYSSCLVDSAWLLDKSRLVKIFYFLSFGNLALLGLPLAAIADLRRLVTNLRSSNLKSSS